MEKYIHLEFQPLLLAMVFNLCVPMSDLENLFEDGFWGPTPRDSGLVDLRQDMKKKNSQAVVIHLAF